MVFQGKSWKIHKKRIETAVFEAPVLNFLTNHQAVVVPSNKDRSTLKDLDQGDVVEARKNGYVGVADMFLAKMTMEHWGTWRISKLPDHRLLFFARKVMFGRPPHMCHP